MIGRLEFRKVQFLGNNLLNDLTGHILLLSCCKQDAFM